MQEKYKQAHDALKIEAIEGAFLWQAMSQGVDVIYMNEMKPELMADLCAALRKAASGNTVGQIIVMPEPTLSVAIKRLSLEKNEVQAKLATLPASEWSSDHGRALDNREQELFTTLDVLQRMLPKLDSQPAKERNIEDLEVELLSERRHHGAMHAAAVKTLGVLGYTWLGGSDWVAKEVRQTGCDEVMDAIRERDEAEEFGDKLLDLVLGDERHEWSSAYGTDDALLQVEQKMMALSKLGSAADARDAELLRGLHWATSLLGTTEGDVYQEAMPAEAMKVSAALNGEIAKASIEQYRGILEAGLTAARAMAVKRTQEGSDATQI